MGVEAQANVVFVPGLYWNLPGVGEHNRQANNDTAEILQASLGELATVELHDAGFHDEGTPLEKEEMLDAHITEIAERTSQPVRVAGSSLGGNLALGASLRLGPDVVSKSVAISAPLSAKGSPPPGIRLDGGDDIVFVERLHERLRKAQEEDLARLTSIHGAHDVFVKPAWSQWEGIDTHTVPGFWHPRIIKNILKNERLMRMTLLEPSRP
ncbi:MAG TPA: hypothetical protein VFK11_02980 [Candidatus Saccharimonadales bacterium]|nr:hypothetical protein [Candidatus Saccharimonadales bacterium]